MAALAPEHEFVCFLDRKSADVFRITAPNVRPVVIDVRESAVVAASASGRRTLRDILRMTRGVAREPLDVFLSPSVYTFFPLPIGLRAVVTIYDAIPERFSKLTFPSTRSKLFWRMKVRLALMQSRLVLTISDHAADEIARTFGIPRNRLRVSLPPRRRSIGLPRARLTLRQRPSAWACPQGPVVHLRRRIQSTQERSRDRARTRCTCARAG